jgi:hypothetical protein
MRLGKGQRIGLEYYRCFIQLLFIFSTTEKELFLSPVWQQTVLYNPNL